LCREFFSRPFLPGCDGFFVNIGRMNLELIAGVAQERLTARGRAGEN
jgi:hypothetical protein